MPLETTSLYDDDIRKYASYCFQRLASKSATKVSNFTYGVIVFMYCMALKSLIMSPTHYSKHEWDLFNFFLIFYKSMYRLKLHGRVLNKVPPQSYVLAIFSQSFCLVIEKNKWRASSTTLHTRKTSGM